MTRWPPDLVARYDRRMSINQAVADRLAQIAKLQDLLGEDKFKAISHDKAARLVEGLGVDLATLANDKNKLLALDGIGPKIADKIIEFVTTGKMTELETLRAKVPAGLLPLMQIPGLGPKTVAVLWKEGGVESLAGLKKIIADGSILKLPRMGEKSVQKLVESIAIAEEGNQRLALGLATPIADAIVARMKKIKGVKQAAYAGSLRRAKETIGDIDILVTTTDADAVTKAFCTMPEVTQVISSGETRSSVRCKIGTGTHDFDPAPGDGAGEAGAAAEKGAGTGGEVAGGERTIQVDLRVLPDASWGAALMYFTGSKDHNIRLRGRALDMGMTLNDYGLFPDDKEEEPPHKRGVKPIVSKTEEEIYAKLGLAWVPPEMREDRGEVEVFELGNPNGANRANAAKKTGKGDAKAAASAKTPKAKSAAAADTDHAPFDVSTLVAVESIKAELHAHTTASDGVMSIEELATNAKQRGFHTIAVTDHSKSSVIANGLQPARLHEHIKAVRAVGEKMKGITVLTGSEVDILADGSLDYDDALLAELDVVVASPHNALGQDSETATKRLLKAVSHPMVHILGHPTGRLINKRAGLSPDMEKIIAAAVKHGVALEINAHWLRLDLRDTHVRMAVDMGALIAIDCDVHSPEDFDNLRYGVATGRRGWLRAERCVNTWSAKRLHEWLRAKR